MTSSPQSIKRHSRASPILFFALLASGACSLGSSTPAAVEPLNTRPNAPVWASHAMISRDGDKASAFYRNLAGWSFKPDSSPIYGATLRASSAQGQIGEFVTMPAADAAEVPPHWLPQVFVDDINSAVRRARELGGYVPVAPTPVDGVGKFAVVADPVGVHLGLLEAAASVKERPAASPLQYHQLTTEQPSHSTAFFKALLGWSSTADASGAITLMSGEAVIGSVVKSTDIAPQFVPFIPVDRVTAAATRARAAGGTLLRPEFVITPETHGLIIQDSLGAVAGLIGK